MGVVYCWELFAYKEFMLLGLGFLTQEAFAMGEVICLCEVFVQWGANMGVAR